jgi:pimeloyl-ACP methyl ester carboxylesterase
MKEIIKNRKKEVIVVLIENQGNNHELVFIMHGLGYNKEEPCIATVAEFFKQKNYNTLRFDATNTFGESDGKFENATFTSYYEDLEDVINWAKTQEWYKEPFVIAGHSLGGLCAMLFAEEYPLIVKAIVSISAIISGKLASEKYPKEILDEVKRKGIYEWKDGNRIKKLKWNFLEDALKYDSLRNISAITMPVIIIVGEYDSEAPVSDQKILYDSIPGKKDLKVIKGAPHIFKDKGHLDEIKNLLGEWIKESIKS